MPRRTLIALLLIVSLGLMIFGIPALVFFCGPAFPSSWYEIRPGVTFGSVDRLLHAQGMSYSMRRELDGTWDLFYAFDYDIDDQGSDPWYGNELQLQVKIPDPIPSSETHSMPTETAISSVVLFRFPRHRWMRGWPFYVGETQLRLHRAP